VEGHIIFFSPTCFSYYYKLKICFKRYWIKVQSKLQCCFNILAIHKEKRNISQQWIIWKQQKVDETMEVINLQQPHRERTDWLPQTSGDSFYKILWLHSRVNVATFYNWNAEADDISRMETYTSTWSTHGFQVCVWFSLPERSWC
jgi:hypothetical protein